MDAVRLEWLQDRKIKKFHFLHWLYWIASGYGERINRAVVALVMLWLLFAFSYTKVGFEHKTNNPGNDQQSIAAQVDLVGKPLVWADPQRAERLAAIYNDRRARRGYRGTV
jgi:hypothetical protein